MKYCWLGRIQRDVVLLLAALLGAVTSACADQYDTLNYSVSAGMGYDDNVFRLPVDADPLLYTGQPYKSDITRTVALGIVLDKKYSNQEFSLNAQGTDYKYRNLSSLNYTSSSIKGAWNARLTSRLNATLSAVRVQSLINPADSRQYTRNLNTSDNAVLSGDVWLDGAWHALFGLSNAKSGGTINDVNYLNSRSTSREAGLKYDRTNGKSLALISRHLQVVNANSQPNPLLLLDTGFDERQLELRAEWQISTKSTLSASMQKLERNYFNYFQLDYQGNQGSLNFMQSLTGKSFINVSLQRSINSWLTAYSTHYVADNLTISPSWQAGAGMVVRGAVSRGRSEYVAFVPDIIIPRQDTLQSAQLGIDWTPQRALTISVSLQHNKRLSTPDVYSTFGYVDNSASVSLQASF